MKKILITLLTTSLLTSCFAAPVAPQREDDWKEGYRPDHSARSEGVKPYKWTHNGMVLSYFDQNGNAKTIELWPWGYDSALNSNVSEFWRLVETIGHMVHTPDAWQKELKKTGEACTSTVYYPKTLKYGGILDNDGRRKLAAAIIMAEAKRAFTAEELKKREKFRIPPSFKVRIEAALEAYIRRYHGCIQDVRQEDIELAELLLDTAYEAIYHNRLLSL